MGEVWEPEEVVAAELARDLVESAFPELAPATVVLLGEGWDNTVYRVNGTLVFRFPRRQVAVPLLEHECAILPRLAPHLPLPIPNPTYVGAPSAAFRWPFAGYALIEGRAALGLDADARAGIASPLARFLSALHRFPALEAPGLSFPRDEFARLDVGRRTPMIEERLARAVELQLVSKPDARRCDAVLGGVPSDWKPETNTLVHGDLYCLHLLVDRAQAPVGVIDWGDIHVGDRAIDLSLAHLALPPSARDVFRREYEGTVTDATWAAARFRALLSCVTTLVYAADIADAELLRESKVAFGFIVGP